jgi:hypothetical protein
MLRRMLLGALAGLAAVLAAPDAAAGPTTEVNCTASDPFACALNGVCAGGACQCDAPWGGDACATLLFAPGVETACGPLCACRGRADNDHQ